MAPPAGPTPYVVQGVSYDLVLYEQARELVNSSATAAVDLLVANRHQLTRLHYQRLSSLGVTSTASTEAQVTFDTLASDYKPEDIQTMLGSEKNSWTASEVFASAYKYGSRLCREYASVKEELQAVRVRMERQKDDHQSVLSEERKERKDEKEMFERKVKQGEEDLQNHQNYTKSKLEIAQSTQNLLEQERDAAQDEVTRLQEYQTNYQKTRLEIAREWELRVSNARAEGTTVSEKCQLDLDRMKYEKDQLQVKHDKLEKANKTLQGSVQSLQSASRQADIELLRLAKVKKTNERLSASAEKTSKELSESQTTIDNLQTELVNLQESNSRKFERLKAANSAIKAHGEAMDKEESIRRDLESQRASLEPYKTCIQLLAPHIHQSAYATPQALVQHILDEFTKFKDQISQLESTRTPKGDSSKQSEELEKRLEEERTLVRQLLKDSGRFENEQSHHVTTKRSLKAQQDKTDRLSQEIEQLKLKVSSKVAQAKQARIVHDTSLQTIRSHENTAKDHEEKISKLQAEATVHEELAKSHQAQIEKLEGEVSEGAQTLQKDFNELEVKHSTLEKSKAELQRSLEAANGRVGKFMTEANTATEQLRTAVELFGTATGDVKLPQRIKELITAKDDALAEAKQAATELGQKVHDVKRLDEQLTTQLNATQKEKDQVASKQNQLEEVRRQLETQRQAVEAEQRKLSNVTNSLNALKRSLGFYVFNTDDAVEQEVKSLQETQESMNNARRKLGLHISNGDVCAGIDEIQSKIITATSSAERITQVTSTKEQLQSQLDKIKNVLDMNPDAVNFVQAIEQLKSELRQAQGDTRIVFSIRAHLNMSSHLDPLSRIKELSKGCEQLTELDQDARKMLKIDLSSVDIVASIQSWMQRAQGAESSVDFVRHTLSIAPDRDFNTAVKAVKTLVDQANLARGTLLMTDDEIDINLRITDIKTDLDSNKTLLKTARVSLDIDPSSGDVRAGINKLQRDLTTATDTINDARNCLQLDINDTNLSKAIKNVQSELGTASHTADEREKAINLVTSTFGIVGDFQVGVKNIQNQLGNASNIIKDAQAALKLDSSSTNLAATIMTIKGDLESTRQSNDANIEIVKKARRSLNLTDNLTLEQGIDGMKQKLETAVVAISKAQSALSLTGDNNDLAGAVQAINSELNEAKEVIQKARDALSLSDDRVTLKQGIDDIQQKLMTACGVIEKARGVLLLEDGDTDLARAIGAINREFDEARNVRDARVEEIKQTRASLNLSDDRVTLKEGVDAMLSKLTNANSAVIAAQKSLSLDAGNLNLATTIDEKLRLAGIDANQVAESRTLLDLEDQVTLTQGIRNAQKELRETKFTIRKAKSYLGPQHDDQEHDGTLENGLVKLQDDFSQAKDVIRKAQKSLDMDDSDQDLVTAINNKANTATRILSGKEGEIRDARQLLGLNGDVSLKQGVESSQEELRQTKEMIEKARTQLVLADNITLEQGIGKVQSDLQQSEAVKSGVYDILGLTKADGDVPTIVRNVNNQLTNTKKELGDVRALLNIDPWNTTTTIQQSITGLQSNLNAANVTISDAQLSLNMPSANTDLASEITKLSSKASDAEDLLDEARTTLSLTSTGSVNKGIISLQTKLRNVQTAMTRARPNFIDVKSETSLATEITAMASALTNAQSGATGTNQDIQKAINSLGLAPGTNLVQGTTSLRQALDTANNVIRLAQTSLGLAPTNTALASAIDALKSDVRSHEKTVERIGTELGVKEGEVLIEVLQHACESKVTLDNIRGELDDDEDVDERNDELVAIHGIREVKRQVASDLRSLLIPGEDLDSIGELTHTMLLRLMPQGSLIDADAESWPQERALDWSLEVAGVFNSDETFAQLIVRLKGLTAFGSDTTHCLKVVESLICKVSECTDKNIKTIAGVLRVTWELESTLVQEETKIQALLEARIIELLFRGTAQVLTGRDSLLTVVNNWSKIHSSVIDKHLILRAYSSWFQSIGSGRTIGLPYTLASIAVGPQRPIEMTKEYPDDSRQLVGRAFAEESHCLLLNTHAIYLYAIDDLEYHLPDAVTVFPRRLQSGNVLVAQMPFTESLSARFVEREMPSLFVRGLTTTHELQ